MQDWTGQAGKNHLKIEETEPCQLCGAATLRGISECVDLASPGTHRIDHRQGVEAMTIFLSVDVHAAACRDSRSVEQLLSPVAAALDS